jgi:DNA-binding XRE family transcriptional regulator
VLENFRESKPLFFLIKIILFDSITMKAKIRLLLYYQNFDTMASEKNIGQNIKKIRAKLSLTQDDLVKKADIKYTTLTKIESGVVKKPSVQTMAKIAKALGVLIEDLLV